MWPRNTLTDRLGIDVAIIQAPMAGANTPALSAAVSNAGALGSLGLGTSAPQNALKQILEHRQKSNRAINANFFCHEEPRDVAERSAPMRAALQPIYDELQLGPVPEASVPYRAFDAEHADVLQEARPPVVSFHFGLPAPELLKAVRETGAFIMSSATTVREALWLEAQGVDAIIAQGTEAGGHRGTFQGTDVTMQPGLFALLPQIVSRVDVPVIAAGGIVNGATIAAALALGASAVQMGTAFLRCPEAGIHPAHRRTLASAGDDATRVTRLFSGKPARSVRNSFMDRLQELEGETAPYPSQLSLSVPLKAGASDETAGDVISLWSGQSVALTRELPAHDLVSTLVEETEHCIGRLSGGTSP